MISVTFVVFPIAFIAAFLSWRYDTPSPPLMYVLGIPLGLLGVSLGLINIFSERSDLNALAPATAILLLTICSSEQFQVWVIYGAGPNDANASDTFSLGSDLRHSSRLSCLYGVT